MASQTGVEFKSPAYRQTAPATPPSQRKGNFFKRHLGTRRRSSVSFPNAQPPSPQAQAHPRPTSPQAQREPPKSPNMPKSAIRKASVSSQDELTQIKSNGTDATTGTDGTNGTPVSPDERPQSPPQGQKSGGVRWAAGYHDQASTRVRRTSSAGTGGRRSSIYLKIEGGFVEGVDAGVGSKARRLSVHIPDELQVDECPLANHFSIISRHNKKDIGEGGAAVVRLMKSTTAGTGKEKVFAVKEFREREADEEQEWEYVRKIKSEYAIAKSCQHPNIVETYRLCFADKKWFHVMEYCDLGDLNDIINKGYFSPADKECMFKQLLRGVDYLHSRGIAHRDIKSENLLLTKNGCLKLADFGTAEVFCGTHPGLNGCRRQSVIKEGEEIRLCKPGMVGSRPYMAPEIIKHEADYDPRAVDVWSCAIVFVTLCCGATPWEAASTNVKNYNIYCNTWDEWLERFPDGIIEKEKPLPKFAYTKQFAALGDPGCRALAMGMLHPDPSKRWSAHDALATQAVTEFECCQQQGYSDDIKTRQRKVLHNHVPPDKAKSNRTSKIFQPGYNAK